MLLGVHSSLLTVDDRKLFIGSRGVLENDRTHIMAKPRNAFVTVLDKAILEARVSDRIP